MTTTSPASPPKSQRAPANDTPVVDTGTAGAPTRPTPRTEFSVKSPTIPIPFAATLALIYPPGIGVVVPGERWDDRAQPMLDYFMAFEESFNRFPGFNYEVQGVYQERNDGRITFHTYAVRES